MIERIEYASDARLADYQNQILSPVATRNLHGRKPGSRPPPVSSAASARARSWSPGRALEGCARSPGDGRPGRSHPAGRYDLVRRIVGFNFHRGCVAVGARGAELLPATLIEPPGRRLLLVLEDVTNPDNVGAVFRNGAAFGADGVLLSLGCADPLYRKSIRVSIGSSLCLPFARLARWPDDLRVLREVVMSPTR
jgi:hypothetical protein